MKAKIVTVIMGQDCEKFIGMCLESVKDSDAIVYCDGGSTDGTLHIVNKFEDTRHIAPTTISNKFDKEDPTMNGRQRNFYLDYVKKNYPDYYCLALDADEVVEDFGKLRKWIDKYGDALVERHPCISVKMRHFIGDLGHEDATVKEHFVLNRLFKICEGLYYPEVEHPVLQCKDINPCPDNFCRETVIWHLAYIPNLWDIKKRYDGHMLKSNMHTPEYLKQWYRSHLFGQYPKSQIVLTDIPSLILDTFGIDKDELYFANRGLEVKHFIDAKHWKDFFDCKTACEFGCGRGPRVLAMNAVGVTCTGVELSQFAVDNAMAKDRIVQGTILEKRYYGPSDLVLAYDVLEHIRYEDLDDAINTILAQKSKHILISVPVIGDPNLENDKTHIIKETKDWWVRQFTDKGLVQIATPNHFLFRQQVMIFEVKK